MLRWLMQHMQNATRNRLGYSKMAYEMQLDNMLLNTFSSKCIEIQCGLYDAPSPVHARQMNECKHAKHKYANQNIT